MKPCFISRLTADSSKNVVQLLTKNIEIFINYKEIVFLLIYKF